MHKLSAFEIAAFVKFLRKHPDWGFLKPLREHTNPAVGSVRPVTENDKELINVLARLRATERIQLFEHCERCYSKGVSYE